MKQKKKIKVRWKNVFKFFSFCISLIIFTLLLQICLSFFREYNLTIDIQNDLEENTKVSQIVDDDAVIKYEPSDTLSKFDMYYTYINYSMLEVDLSYAKSLNKDIWGYMEINGFDLPYFIVSTSDNEYYKNHSLDKSENYNGWVYLNSLNSTDELDQNTIIYGNNNLFNTLFGKLDSIFDKDWEDNSNNYVIKLYTENFTTLWQIVSTYKTSESLYTDIINKSEYDFNVSISSSDKILTLVSTGSKEDIVIHAKLIKIKNYNE